MRVGVEVVLVVVVVVVGAGIVGGVCGTMVVEGIGSVSGVVTRN